MDKKLSEQLAIKYVFPYGSYLVALLAIAFNVGYFTAIDINLFTIFSLSEHVLFALQALPIAFVIPCIFYIFYVVFDLFLRRIEQRGFEPRYFGRFVAYGAVVVTIVSFFVVRFVYGIPLDISPPILLGFWCGFTVECWLAKRQIRFYLIGASLISLVASFWTGAELATTYLYGKGPDAVEQQLTMVNGNTIAIRLIRAGERGVLFFDLHTEQIQLRKWDDIASIKGVPFYKVLQNRYFR